jgi:hypothetical protein
MVAFPQGFGVERSDAHVSYCGNCIASGAFEKMPLSVKADFSPALPPLARKLDKELFVGLEYYADFGKIGGFAKLPEQQHTLFAVTDFKRF